jgi:stalled ribosome rescue protein Dom34
MTNLSLQIVMGRTKRKKRGFPVGVLVGFDEQVIHIWKIFSESVKKYDQIPLERKWKNATEKDRYHFYEDLLNMLRDLIERGLKSILLVSPQGKNWSEGFRTHLEKHHRWLIGSRGNNQASFGQISGKARSYNEVRYLLEQETTKEIINKVTSQEAYFLIKELEKSINSNNPNIKVLYGLKEIEDVIYEGGKRDDSVSDELDYLLLTDEFLENHKQKNRVYRLKQIANNKGITTKIISEESPAGERIAQFGGIMSFKTVGYF